MQELGRPIQLFEFAYQSYQLCRNSYYTTQEVRALVKLIDLLNRIFKLNEKGILIKMDNSLTSQIMLEIAGTLNRLKNREITAHEAVAASKLFSNMINLESNNLKRAVLLASTEYAENYEVTEPVKALEQ